jgi:hypothetical protein
MMLKFPLNTKSMKPLTKNILDRMFERAEEIMSREGWNQHDMTIFKTDPIIHLLYGACAEEIGKVHEEIFHTGGRLIHKTIEHFLPDEFRIPSPAHGIFYGRCQNKLVKGNIGTTSQIAVLKQEFPPKSFIFTPAGEFTLYKAEVEYFLFRNHLYQAEGKEKKKIIEGSQLNSLQDNVLWVGIKDLPAALPMDKLNLFFSLPQAGKDQFGLLNAIKYCKCSDGTDTIKSYNGLPVEDTDIREKMLESPDYIIYKLLQNVKDWYQKHFITLYDLRAPGENDSSFPEEFAKIFPASQLNKIQGDIFWVKLTFSNLLEESWINQLFCSINCFPALNLKVESEIFDVDSMPINIFPISSNDSFISIQSIKGKVRNLPEETNYRLLDANVRETVGREGEVLFRAGNLSRFEPGKLKAMLNLMINLLKEETILLTKDGTKEDLEKLYRLNRALLDFEKSVVLDKNNKGKFTGNLILRPYKDHSRVYIRFWTTAGEDANEIQPFTGNDAVKQCKIEFCPDLRSESLRLITVSGGGRGQPTEEEHINTVRKLLLTRNRIITVADIKAFCYEHFSPHKIRVDVKKGYLQSQKPSQGVLKVMDIDIQLLEKGVYNTTELLFLKEELLQKLEQNSSNTIPFRVDIN